jgi:3',5'-cyclic AMP phosphodiesterase CpdA
MFVLAHLSDPHLPSVPRPTLRELMSKRAIGLANWHWRRRREHRLEALDAILADIALAQPDHVAVTGDLVNVALPGEFVAARGFLSRLGPPDRVTLVPGNHDAYVGATMTHAAEQWADYMRGDDGGGFPFVRRRGPIALVGVSTGVPTRPFRATGILGADQLARLDERLGELDAARAMTIVLIHHPPTPFPHDRHKNLLDAEALRTVLLRHRVAMVLHGHMHVNALTFIEGAGIKIPVFGVPSASMAKGNEPAGYNLYAIEIDGAFWRIDAVSRALYGNVIAERARETLSGEL